MWIGPIIVLIASILLGPLLVSDVFGEEKVPEKYAPDRLLIKFKNDVSTSQKYKLLKENGAVELSEIKPLGIKVIKVPEHALESAKALLSKKYVEYVELDYMFEPAAIPNDPYFSNQWHLQSIKAAQAWDISKGSSIPIAILDTGVDPNHPDLKDKLTLGYNFYNNNNDWKDVCGHGTAVAGSAAAITNNGIGVSGVAWNNPIIPIRISDTNCYGYYSSIINGIVYAANNDARVVNISFQIFNGAALTDAARYMHDRGGWVVAAAGNTGKLESYSDNPYIISVGATSSSGAAASFSSYGPYVDFAAPGSSILTTRAGGTYGYASGTSFASPIVAGVVGLVISNNPSMTSQQVYDAIKNSAIDKGTAGRDANYGWGIVDAYGALSQNKPPPPIDTSPPAVTITNPQNGAYVTGSFTVSVSSSDNVAVSKVELYLDGVLNGQRTSTPYNFALDASTMSEGTHEIKAVSVDSSGNSNFAKITVTKKTSDTTPPTVTITNPQDGSTISGLTMVSVAATDDIAVSYVELYVNDVLLSKKIGSPYDFAIDAKNLPPGSNVLKAKAVDSTNNFSEDTITVLVQENTVPPSISITNPTNGAIVSGYVKMSAVPSNFATTPSVNFFIDGVLKSTDASSPYEYYWNTNLQSVGLHTITVQAFDSNGNTASNSISVNIAVKPLNN
ncbi:MAG TPA: S8 family serine peptidase [Nitrosopumilaceae archaeon]|nr:S8 family serine peptidase [Nitrosopumilaceae archaeon]